MLTFNAQPVIDIVRRLANNVEFDREEIEAAINALECLKNRIDANNDEAIDKVDEIQDYLQYALLIEEPLMEEIKTELTVMINDLQEGSNSNLRS